MKAESTKLVDADANEVLQLSEKNHAENFLEEGWKNTSLPAGAERLFLTVERAVTGANAISTILTRNWLHRADAEDNNDGVKYSPLSQFEEYGLEVALGFLLEEAQDSISTARQRCTKLGG